MNFKSPNVYGYIGFGLGVLSSFTNSGGNLGIFSIVVGSAFDGAVLYFLAKLIINLVNKKSKES